LIGKPDGACVNPPAWAGYHGAAWELTGRRQKGGGQAVVLTFCPRWEGRLVGMLGGETVDNSSMTPLLAMSSDFFSTATPTSWLVCAADIAVDKLAMLETDMLNL